MSDNFVSEYSHTSDEGIVEETEVFTRSVTLKFLLSTIVFFSIVLFFLVAAIGGFVYFRFRESGLRNQRRIRPGSVKRMWHNHVVYNPGSKSVARADTREIFVDKNTKASSFSFRKSEDEVFYMSEEEPELICDVTCQCFEDEFEDEYSRRFTGVLIVMEYGLAMVGMIAGLYIERFFLEPCKRKCREEGYEDGEHMRHDCYEREAMGEMDFLGIWGEYKEKKDRWDED